MTDLVQTATDLAPYFVAAAGGAGTALATAVRDRLAGVVVDGFFARLGQRSAGDPAPFGASLTAEDGDRLLDSLPEEHRRQLLRAVDRWRQLPADERDESRLVTLVREPQPAVLHVHQSGSQNLAAQNIDIGTLNMGPGNSRAEA